MSKKLPKYKKDALLFLLDWVNSQFNVKTGSLDGYTKLVYSKERSSITFYPYSRSLPEVEVFLNYNLKGSIHLTSSFTGKSLSPLQISDDEVSKLSASVSQVLQKVPFKYRGEYGIEVSIGFHYSIHSGILSVLGSYNNQYMYPKA